MIDIGSDPGTLIASVPALVGFRPENSLVGLVCDNEKVVVTFRVDLPAPGMAQPVAAQLAKMMHSHSRDFQNLGVILVVFGGKAHDAVEELPHRDLIDAVRQSLGDAVPTVAFWTAEAAAGARWTCYCGNDEEEGTLPDPASTVLATATAAAGLVTLSSRSELTQYVKPADASDLARRTARIEELAAADWSCSPSTGLMLVRAAVRSRASGERTLNDTVIAQLALALQDVHVRDASLSFAFGDQAAAAEELFLTLTRECPAPYRAEPATLAGFYAYLRGDGARAAVALDAAIEACPKHVLANQLSLAAAYGISVDQIAEIAREAESTAKGMIAAINAA